jgi:iron complex outermembrane receptor protein
MKPNIPQRKRADGSWGRLLFASLMSTSALAGAAAAQEDNEIIVTATKRAENIQDVPQSIQALGSATLEEHQVSSFDDYAALLPSVSYQSFGPSQAQLAFRGMTSGGDGLPIGSSPTASMYLDETPVTTIGSTVDLHMYDIARVEALSGPQGTLFGANSLSGVMRVITNAPDPSGFAAGYDVEANMYTDGEPGGGFEGFVNYPLSDNAALRLVGFFDHRGGYMDNVHQTRTYTLDDDDPNTNITIDNAALVDDDINDVETYGGRAALGIDLNENWTSVTTLAGQHQQSDGPFLFDRRLGDDLEVTDFFPTSNTDSWGMISETITGTIGNFDVVYAGSYFDRKIEAESDYSYYSVYYDTFPAVCGDDSDEVCFATYFPDGQGGFLDPSQRFHQVETYQKETHEFRVNSRPIGVSVLPRAYFIKARPMMTVLTSSCLASRRPDRRILGSRRSPALATAYSSAGCIARTSTRPYSARPRSTSRIRSLP